MSCTFALTPRPLPSCRLEIRPTLYQYNTDSKFSREKTLWRDVRDNPLSYNKCFVEKPRPVTPFRHTMHHSMSWDAKLDRDGHKFRPRTGRNTTLKLETRTFAKSVLMHPTKKIPGGKTLLTKLQIRPSWEGYHKTVDIDPGTSAKSQFDC
jgi:hypothetical protein